MKDDDNSVDIHKVNKIGLKNFEDNVLAIEKYVRTGIYDILTHYDNISIRVLSSFLNFEYTNKINFKILHHIIFHLCDLETDVDVYRVLLKYPKKYFASIKYLTEIKPLSSNDVLQCIFIFLNYNQLCYDEKKNYFNPIIDHFLSIDKKDGDIIKYREVLYKFCERYVCERYDNFHFDSLNKYLDHIQSMPSYISIIESEKICINKIKALGLNTRSIIKRIENFGKTDDLDEIKSHNIKTKNECHLI